MRLGGKKESRRRNPAALWRCHRHALHLRSGLGSNLRSGLGSGLNSHLVSGIGSASPGLRHARTLHSATPATLRTALGSFLTAHLLAAATHSAMSAVHLAALRSLLTAHLLTAMTHSAVHLAALKALLSAFLPAAATAAVDRFSRGFGRGVFNRRLRGGRELGGFGFGECGERDEAAKRYESLFHCVSPFRLLAALAGCTRSPVRSEHAYYRIFRPADCHPNATFRDSSLVPLAGMRTALH